MLDNDEIIGYVVNTGNARKAGDLENRGDGNIGDARDVEDIGN